MSRLGTGKADPPTVLVHAIVAEYAALAGLPPEIIYTRDRRNAVSWIRGKVCQRLLRAGYTTIGIGRRLGIDHATVMGARHRKLSDVPPALGDRISTLGASADRLGVRVLALVNTVPHIRVCEVSRHMDISEQSASDAMRRLYHRGEIKACGKPGHYKPLKYTAPVINIASVRGPESFIRPISKERMMAGR